MFEVPDAKRVRREDLHASEESSWSESEADAELEARLNAQIAKSLGLDESAFRAPKPQTTSLPIVTKPKVDEKKKDDELSSSDEESEPKTPAEGSPSKQGGEDDDEVYAFRLFSAAGPAPQVVLENTNRVVEGKMIRGRPLSYYLVTDLSAEKKQQYEMAAVSGEDVIERSKVRAWGLELPWRVTTIKATSKRGRGAEAVAHVEDDQPAKRKRPGKKRRTAMRIKARAKAQAEEAAKQKMVEKEEHVKDKKKRLNRLKKLRRRAKKKTEKGGGGEAGGESDEDMSEQE
ncbi:hypothetical protein HDV63DRAFT_364430 [Trichoderma sp. SZMC 28014]